MTSITMMKRRQATITTHVLFLSIQDGVFPPAVDPPGPTIGAGVMGVSVPPPGVGTTMLPEVED
jgi:hypothetical protein